MSIFRIYKPERFQGNLRKKKYFEGWYFKHVSAGQEEVLAFIPGVSLSDDSHSFVQLIDGKTGQTKYYRYPLGEFQSLPGTLDIRIGENHFSREGIRIRLQDGQNKVEADLSYGEWAPFPVSLVSPGIMGWYAYVPFMECYHGIVSATHEVNGRVSMNNREISFDHGTGYIEKDWGRSFPESYIWLQANTFQAEPCSLMFSLARIPWLGRSFPGFLCFVYLKGKYYRFTTYTGAKIVSASLQNELFHIILESKTQRIEIRAHHGVAGDLQAPVFGNMQRVIRESVDSEIQLDLQGTQGSLFSGKSACAGFETSGDLPGLLNRILS